MGILFPLRKRPVYSYKTDGREFGAWRSGGRLHAGCDLLADRGVEILAVENGTVIQGPYYFYQGTYALEVNHDSGIVVRYGEILQSVPRGIGPGARISRGQVIAYVGQLSTGSSMLHFEMYQGTASGELTTGSGPYRRRSDLLDPTPYLDQATVGAATPPRPLQPGEARVNDRVSSVLNLRSAAKAEAPIVVTLSPGTIAKVLAKATGEPYLAGGSTRTDWVELEVGGQTGFAAGYYLEIAAVVGTLPDQDHPTGKAIVNNQVTSTLNLRSAADAQSVIVSSLSPGAVVDVIDRVAGQDYTAGGAIRNDWYKLKTGIYEGFVAGFYLDFDAQTGAIPAPLSLGKVNSAVSSVLNVRERPALDASIVFTVSPGQGFEILEPATGDVYAGGRNDWQHIRLDGKTGYAAGFYISVNQQNTPQSKWDAVLLSVPTTGASAITASQDGLPPGIDSSERMAQADLERVKKISNVFQAASARYGIPAALIAATASRETRVSSVLSSDGWDADHNAFGILQVDKRFHAIAGSDSPFSQAHVEQATGILASYVDAVKDLHPEWEDIYVLKGAVAAYNSGPGSVQTKNGMDLGTTGNDYSSDVIARAQYYLQHVELPMFRQ